jgi:hypothetical protein
VGFVKTVRLAADIGSVENAAHWLREHLAVSDYEIIEPQFEEHFGCRVVRDPADDFVYGRIYVEFDDEQAAALFVLRWS